MLPIKFELLQEPMRFILMLLEVSCLGTATRRFTTVRLSSSSVWACAVA